MANLLTTIRKLGEMWKTIGMYNPPPDDISTSERPTKKWAFLEGLIDLSNERRDKYRDYEEMDKQIDELSSSLDLYADFIVSGGTESEDVYSVEAESTEKKIADTVENLEKKLNLKSRVWFLSRNIAKYGDTFYEVVVDPYEVVKFVFLNPYTMFVNKDKTTGQIIANFPYTQRDLTYVNTVATFEPWEIVHYKLGEADYGVDNSILFKCRRTYKIVRMIEDSVLIGRLTRAHQRMVFKVDVSNMGALEGLKYVQKLADTYKSRRYVDDYGRFKTEINPMKPQEDIWLPSRKDKASGVDVISGDISVTRIDDVEYFHNKLFAATKVPKAYLGFEHDVNAKATLTEQHLSFSKSVRRFRHVLATGLKHLYKVEFIMKGIDPNSFDWKIKFPGLGSADEQMRWSIEQMKASVVNTYTNSGFGLPVEWIIRHMFMDLTPAEADELVKMWKEDSAKTTAQMPGLNQGQEPQDEKNPPPPGGEEEPEEPVKTKGKKPGKPGNGKPTEKQVEHLIELLKQDNDFQQAYGRFVALKRGGSADEYY